MVNNSKVDKFFTHKIISFKRETNSNSLGLVGRERPPFLNALHIEAFGWTSSNSSNLFGVTWFFFILSFYLLTFFVHSCIMLLSKSSATHHMMFYL